MDEKWEITLEEAKSYLEKGDTIGAIRICDEVINLPESVIPRKIRAAALVIRGNAYEENGDIDRATRDYDESINLDP